MDDFKKLPKGNVKRNGNFYLWASLATMLVLFGLLTIFKGEFHNRAGVLVFKGTPAVIVGSIFALFGLYFLYHLFFKVEMLEKKHDDYHELSNFRDTICGHQTKFEVENAVTLVGGRSFVPVVYYVLEVFFRKNLDLGLFIKQRDKVERFLWKVGVTRSFRSTGSHYLDSKYRVKCRDMHMFRIVFNENTMQLLEKFDRDYPPIRKKNGILKITDSSLRYTEGPYNEEQRVLDPHRGKIEDLFRQLINIVIEIERQLPRNQS